MTDQLPRSAPSSPAPQRERLPRRTPAQTRELMLSAAVDLMRERAQASGDPVLAAALAHVRLTTVAERATAMVRERTGDATAKAITTGAIYQQWPSQADFQVDLLFHIAELQSALVPGLPESVKYFAESRAGHRSLQDMLASLMHEVHEHYREDPLFRVELSFLLGANDPRLRAAIAHRQAAFYQAADPAWQALLETFGLRMRPPYTIRDLTRSVSAHIAGSVVVWFSDPEILHDPLGEEGASLMSRAILAIVESVTEPAG